MNLFVVKVRGGSAASILCRFDTVATKCRLASHSLHWQDNAVSAVGVQRMSDIKKEDITEAQEEHVTGIKEEGEVKIKQEANPHTKQEEQPHRESEQTLTPLQDNSSSTAHNTSHNSPNPAGLKVYVVLNCREELINTDETHFTHCIGVYNSLAHAVAVVHRLVRERPPANANLQTVEEFLADERECTRISDGEGVVRVVGYKYFTREGLGEAVWVEEKVVRAEEGGEEFARVAFDSGMVTFLR